MSEFLGKHSKYVLLHGCEAAFVECIAHGGDGKPIVVYTDPSGTRLYATEDEWLDGSRQFAQQAHAQGIITSDSPAKDKLTLFRKLFKGREDVYAHGYRRKDGGIGYAPACINEWKPGTCPKKINPRSPCADCAHRAFTPLDDAALIAHFKGARADLKDVVGLYVLNKEGKTSVLVADFDKTGWKAEIAAYRHACEETGIGVAVERSRSGNGGHAWIFFSEPLDAALARNLGCTLITHAMTTTGKLSFKAYDRLFPAQTTVAAGGFGNLIALPFQGLAQQQGNSVFVDEHFEAYSDQWKYLSAIQPVTPDHARQVVEQTQDGPLGPLAFAEDKPHREKPWAPRTKTSLSRDDFPATVSLTKANMLFVEKDGLSPAATNRIRRLAAFGNPEFYRAQAMHQSVFGKHRVIDLSEEFEQYLALPRGCESKLVALLDYYGISYHITDARHTGAPIDVAFKGTLRPLQQTAVDALLEHECGILSAPTGFGKTVIGAYCIAHLKMRTLVIAPGTALLTQWQQRLETFLTINEELPELLTKTGRKSRKKRSLVGQIGGGKNVPSGIVDIATFQSLFEKGDVENAQQLKDLVRKPRLDTLILAAPASWEGVITQYSGRLHREHEGKSTVIVYDYIDASVPMLDRMYKKRLRTYQKLGYDLAIPENTSQPVGCIVNATDYQPLLANDLENGSKSLFFSAPYLNKKRLSQLKPLLESAVQRGISVTIVVSKPTKTDYVRPFEEEVAALREIGCTVTVCDERPSALAIIDEHIVWYGTIPLLAFPKTDDCSLRFESSEVAHDLLPSNAPSE